MDQITEFLKYHYKSEWSVNIKRARDRFISIYTTDAILNLSQREYYYPGNKNSFCHRIQEDLAPLASMGNAYPSVFGAYVSSDGTRKLNPTLQNMFGDNYDAALQYQKKQIVSLIKAGKEQNYPAIERSPIYQQLKFKILLVYFPELYFPVCTKIALEGYCNAMGMNYLHCTVVYENISAGSNCLGFASDGVTKISISRNGRKRGVLYPRDTIVLDKYLTTPSNESKRRFVLGHEAGHVITGRIYGNQAAYHNHD